MLVLAGRNDLEHAKKGGNKMPIHVSWEAFVLLFAYHQEKGDRGIKEK